MSASLPTYWATAPLKDVCLSVTDGDHQAPPRAESGVPFITISAINDGDLQLSRAARFVPQSYYDALATERRPRPGDILFSVTGSVGIAAPVDIDTPFVFQRHIAIIRPNPSTIDRNFLLYFLRCPPVQNLLRDAATGTAQMTIPLSALRSLPVRLPALAEQRRIVARIEALFARTRRARADLKRVAVLARRHRDRALATAFDEEWPKARVADVALASFDGPFGSSLKSGDYVASGTRVVRLENIGHLQFIAEKETFITDAKAADLARHKLAPGDVLFSSFVDKEIRVCLLPEGLPTVAINKADCFCIRADAGRCDPAFLAYRLAAPTTYGDMREAVHGATRPRISLSDLKDYVIGLPSLDEQRAVVTKIEGARAATHLVEREGARALALLDHMDQAVLAKAFRGELVPQDPADEPAEALLARLQRPVATSRKHRARAALPG